MLCLGRLRLLGSFPRALVFGPARGWFRRLWLAHGRVILTRHPARGIDGAATVTDAVIDPDSGGRMNVAVNLWRLIQEDRLVRYAAFATAAVLWFAIAWADIMILLVGMTMVGLSLWFLRRQRERRGWFQEREVDVDLL